MSETTEAMETVVITGASRGIGLGLVRRYLDEGRRVVAACRNPAGSRELGAHGGHPNLQVVALDVRDGDAVDRLGGLLSGETVDVLVNNAGVMGGSRQSVADMDYGGWRDAFEVNTIAPFRVTIALRAHLQRSARPRVVTISSQMGSLARVTSGSYAYRRSKAAVNKVMQGLSLDLAGDGIIVCCVHPGWVRTDMGGAAAELSVAQSAGGLFTLIDRLTPADSGRFFTWDGSEHPW